MVYAMSDLYGCYDKFIKMLEKIGFKDNDSLYIWGILLTEAPTG